MIRLLSVLFVLLALAGSAYTQTQNVPTRSCQDPRSGAAVSCDPDFALMNGLKLDRNGPVASSPDGTTPSWQVGNLGLPQVYLPQHMIFPNTPVQINVGSPFGSRGHAVGAAISVGAGADGGANTSIPPIGPDTDLWNTETPPIATYGNIDEVGLSIAVTDADNYQVVSGVTVSVPNSGTGAGTVTAPGGSAFSAQACQPGMIVALNSTPVLWGAVSDAGCTAANTIMNIIGWSAPFGLSNDPVINTPMQNPHNTALYTLPTPLVLTALAPTHIYGENILASMTPGTPAHQLTMAEWDFNCSNSNCPGNSDGFDLFNIGENPGLDGMSIGGAWTGAGLRISGVIGGDIQVDETSETPSRDPLAKIWVGCLYNYAYNVYNPGQAGGDNSFSVGCDGQIYHNGAYHQYSNPNYTAANGSLHRENLTAYGTIAANGGAAPATAFKYITQDGSQTLTPSSGVNPVGNNGNGSAANLFTGTLMATSTDGSGNAISFAVSISWLLRTNNANPAFNAALGGSATSTVIGDDTLYSTSGCGFWAAFDYPQNVIVPLFFCNAAMPNPVKLYGAVELKALN